MKQLFMMAVAAGVLAVLSAQQANAQYGDSLPLVPSGTAGSEEMLKRCADLGISNVQCSDASIVQAERVEIATNSVERGSGTSMITTELGQMVVFIGALVAVFGGIAGAFYLMGRKESRELAA
jgi:hypothetical protein